MFYRRSLMMAAAMLLSSMGFVSCAAGTAQDETVQTTDAPAVESSTATGDDSTAPPDTSAAAQDDTTESTDASGSENSAETEDSGAATDDTDAIPEEHTVSPDAGPGQEDDRLTDDDKGTTGINTYTTKYGDVHAVTCPVFQFDYPDNWSVTSEETDGVFSEEVILTSDSGATITYMDFGGQNIGTGRMMFQIEAVRAADSGFIPTIPDGTSTDHSYLGNFMVAELRVVGELFMDTDSDFQPVDGGSYYAVVPESYAGIHEVVGVAGIYSEFSFAYPGSYAFIAEPAAGGAFTAAEKHEILSILSSFRTADET